MVGANALETAVPSLPRSDRVGVLWAMIVAVGLLWLAAVLRAPTHLSYLRALSGGVADGSDPTQVFTVRSALP